MSLKSTTKYPHLWARARELAAYRVDSPQENELRAIIDALLVEVDRLYETMEQEERPDLLAWAESLLTRITTRPGVTSADIAAWRKAYDRGRQ